MLQETRATAEWVDTLVDSHARAWGYDPSKLETPLSYWQPTPTAAGGVAILLHPQSKLRTLQPLWEDLWDAHFMALTGTVDGRSVTLACVYASTNKRLRERMFRRLRQRTPPRGLVLVGGDYNCVLDEERDRSRTGRTNTDSPELRHLLHDWQLIDANSADLLHAQSHAEILELHANSHTFSYRLRDGSKASSRLDRWYVSSDAYARVASTLTTTPVCPTDHDAVYITLTDSGSIPTPSRSGRRAVMYPLPAYAQAAIDAVSVQHAAALAERARTWTAEEAASQWDGLKTELRRSCLTAKRVAASKLTNSLRQRTRRTQAALANERRRRLLQEDVHAPDVVATITSRMELLTLDGGDREASLRRQLILLQQAMASRRQRRAISQYDGHSASATRAFFKRMSGRYSRPRVVGASGDDPATRITAARLSDDWRPIVQQPSTEEAAHDAFFSRIRHLQPPMEPDEPFEAFTEEEVLKAIAACPSGKASGPDGIPNDWYKPVAATLAPAMAKTFSAWVTAGVLPTSFKEATVFCLPKVSAPRNGLDFRPISLLNTDYKIFSRLVLQRVQQLVASKVSPAQFGFVAKRQVHDAIDVWDALQARVAGGELPDTATAVMLDFAKAYDTLDRAFLRKALEFHGFSTSLVSAVDAMHLATTARFLADGDMSDVVDIHNGIRQGCPLAPVLFVLAIDLLYSAATADDHISGLQLAPGVTVTLCGYADDTTAYLVHPREESALLQLLDQFGAASGLQINVKKSRAVAMHPQGPTAVHASMQIPVMSSTDLLRLLGMAVASTPSSSTIWTRTFQQVRATLRMASVKTTNLLQRVTICSAVIMPKLLFVGRHAWPSGAIFDQLQRFIHQYAWHATLADGARGSRAWMSAQVATLPTSRGGLGLPDVRAAFSKMSKSTVARWNSSSNVVAAAAGSVLRRLRGGGPAAQECGTSRLLAVQPRLQATLAATGHVALRAERATPREDEELAALTPLLPATGRGRRDEKWWHDGWLHCRYESRASSLAHLRRVQSQLYGIFNAPALMTAPACGGDILRHTSGEAVSRSDFPGLLEPGMAIADVLSVEWVSPRHLRFYCKNHDWPLHPKLADQFRRFCDTLVHNYPALLLPQNAPDELQPRPPSATTWRVRDDAGTRVLVYEPVVDTRVEVGAVLTMKGAASLARQHDPTLVGFDPHPLLDAYAPLWTRRQTTPTNSPPRTTNQNDRALGEVASRERQALNADAVIGGALATVSWKAVTRLPASASRQRLLLHKIKGLRLSGWDRHNNRRGCPHCTWTSGADLGHTYHVMWHCPAAQALWRQLRSGWARLGADTSSTDQEFCAAVFSLRPNQTPPAAWTFLGLAGVATDLITQVHDLVTTVWQQQVLGCFEQIWRWRQGIGDEALPWTLTIASSALRGSFRRAFQQAAASLPVTSLFDRPLRHLLHGLEQLQLQDEPPMPRELQSPTDQFLLFFDGGSRGNPGPGGSGAVVIRTDAFGGRPSIEWAAAMSLADPKTTNNQAEYLGLVTGLKFAFRRRLQPLTVIGDSAMIIAQLRDHRAPKDSCLRRRYGEARILADMLRITKWCHHVRAYNKMADCAANLAMDTRSSIQSLNPTARSCWTELRTYLSEDVGQWQASTHPGQTSDDR